MKLILTRLLAFAKGEFDGQSCNTSVRFLIVFWPIVG
jgi:hypothetical protein